MTSTFSQNRPVPLSQKPCEWWSGFFQLNSSAWMHQSWVLLFDLKLLTDPARVAIKHLTAIQKTGLVRKRKNLVLNVVRLESHSCTLPSSFHSIEEKKPHKAPRESKTNALSPNHIDTVCSHWTYNRVADATANGYFVRTEELSRDSELNERRSSIVRSA